jgi:predicted peptidase
VSQQSQLLKTTVTIPVKTKYLLYLPENYKGSKSRWPLVLFLHGAGECGSNLDRVALHGPPKLAANGKQFPFVMVSPLCPYREWWNTEAQIATLGKLLDDIVSRYRIDRKRIYVTGLSMGGYGTWSLVQKYPKRFAAIGAKDELVLPKLSQDMVKALRKAGGKPKFTVYPDAGHDSWTAAYDNPALYAWLLKQSR